MKSLIFLNAILPSLLVCLSLSSVSAQDVIGESDFESPLYVAGNLEGQDGWSVLEGNAQVVSGVSLRGDQSVRASDATYQKKVSSAASVVWIDSWHQDLGSVSQPLIPSEERSCVICFSSTRGLLALDGDGEGNGVFVTVDAGVLSDQFVRVTLRVDYANARYDVWVNGSLMVSDLGFKDNSVMALEEIQRQSDGMAYLDELTVATRGLDEDRDGDGLTDLDEICGQLGAATSPDNPDSDHDGHSDGNEWIAGTNPLDGSSYLRQTPSLTQGGKFQIQIEARAGRLYTMQSSATLLPDSWEDVPGATDLSGVDGETLTFEDASEPSTRQFYRLSIQNSP